MPDRDILERGCLSGWYKPFRLIMGDSDQEAVSHAAAQCLTESLRRFRFDIILPEVIPIAEAAVLNQDSARTIGAQFRALAQQYDNRYIAVLSRAAQRAINEAQQGALLPSGLSGAIADRFCHDLLSYCLFDRTRFEFIGERFSNIAEAREFERCCKEILAPQVAKIATKLLDGQKPIAPRQIGHKRQTTAELLHQPLIG